VYKSLKIVLQQTAEELFKDCLAALLQRLKSGSRCAEFLAHFSKEWVTKKEQQAYCYGRGLQINTNMYAEAFHWFSRGCTLPVKDLSLTLQSRPWFMQKCCSSLSLCTKICTKISENLSRAKQNGRIYWSPSE